MTRLRAACTVDTIANRAIVDDRPQPEEPRPAAKATPALDEVFTLAYEELRRLASFVRKNEAANATVNSTALVHEAWLKLKDSSQLAGTSPCHFKSVAARAMRQVLVDEARRRGAQKRGGAGGVLLVAFDDSLGRSMSCDADLLALDRALDDLSRLNPRQAEMVEQRFFGGLNVDETAALLGVSASAIDRDWRAAKAWLAGKIRSARE